MKKLSIIFIAIFAVTSCTESKPRTYCETLADSYDDFMDRASQDWSYDRDALRSLEEQMERANCGCTHSEHKKKHDTNQRKDTTKTSL